MTLPSRRFTLSGMELFGLPWHLWLTPIITAVVGYVTNWLAIKMLFRPYAPRFFPGTRLRVPLTPGVFVQHQRQLARQAGDIIAAEILDAQALRELAQSPPVVRAVEAQVHELIARVLHTDWGALEVVLQGEALAQAKAALEALSEKLLVLGARRLEEREFEEKVREVVARVGRLVLARRVGELLPEELSEALRGVLRRRATELLRGPQTRARVRALIFAEGRRFFETPLGNWLGEHQRAALGAAVWRQFEAALAQERFRERLSAIVRARLQAVLASQTPLSAYLPEDYRDDLARAARSLTPDILARVHSWTQDPQAVAAMRRRLHQAIDALLDRPLPRNKEKDWLDRAGRLLKEAGKTALASIYGEDLKRALDRELEAFLETLGPLLEEEKTRNEFSERLCSWLEEWLSRPPREVLRSLPADYREKLAGRISGLLLAGLRAPAVRQQMRTAVETAVGDLLQVPAKSLIPAETDREKLLEKIADVLCARLRHPEVARSAGELLESGFERLLACRVDELFPAPAPGKEEDGKENDPVGRLLAGTAEFLLGQLRSAPARAALAEALTWARESLVTRRIGAPARFLDEPAAQRLQRLVVGEALRLATTFAPEVSRHVPIADKVAERVARFDPKRMEKIVTDAARVQLRWLTYLGGILGFAIGLLQIFLFILVQ